LHDGYRALPNKTTKITTESLKAAFLGKDIVTHSLMEVIKLHNDKIRALIGIEYASGTLKRFLVLERHVQAFLLAKFNYADINIKEVDLTFISDFEFYLRTQNSCANNTAVKYLKNLGKIIRIALSMDWIDKDPMLGYKMHTKPVERPFLTEDELSAILTKEFATERLSQVRDIFIFCCFTGLAYSDVEKLKVTDIFKGIDGTDWIAINRTKTGTRSNVPLLPTAKAILERYQTEIECYAGNKALPVASNQKMNEYLKEIAAVCRINKKLSSHIARHTFATTVTLLNGVPIESVSKMLGHTNIRTTQIYAKVLDQKVSEDMAVLKEKLAEAY